MKIDEEYSRLLGFDVEFREEGKASFLTPKIPENKNYPPTSLPVFYNPASKASRDIAVLFLKAFFEGEKISVCEPLAGTGVRSIRLILETGLVQYALVNDISRNAYELIRINAKLNNVEDIIEASNLDGNELLAARGRGRPRFRYVDVDPAGSPSRFLENGLRGCGKNSVLGVTATDLSALTGAKQISCLRKYDSYPVKTPFMREVAVRILAGFIVRSASRINLSAEPVFSFLRDYYTRVFVKVSPSIEKAKKLLRSIGWISYCPKCVSIDVYRVGEIPINKCSRCSLEVYSSGPLWLGELCRKELVEKMLDYAYRDLEIYREVISMLEYIASEDTSLIGYYPVNVLSSIFRVNPVKPRKLVEELENNGYKATLTHLDKSAFKTDAPPEVIREVFIKTSRS
ncbi:MAG: tRNA (guanine(10)-N(2))-dimethyltransferase [Aigarchaeota archaeon]|nr:tRNA (guanine(10)-N(2))-dimethyltransferase [Aigarchaeota archaeon]MCX8193380.1 tRNA (guanine(10)-N(2))-dimethyltransferase [Nitrososphaeria archaeon]MDW7985910.1 tRNA (guanine(10)-N(2))-dimethyltransferase [Nitrososphaerota archaeon]